MTHVAQKPQLSEHVANRFLDSFRTSVVRKTERNVVIIDAVVTIACPQKSPNLDKHIVRLDWPDNS